MKESEVFFLYNTVKLFNMFTRAKDKYLPYLTADLFFFPLCGHYSANAKKYCCVLILIG